MNGLLQSLMQMAKASTMAKAKQKTECIPKKGHAAWSFWASQLPDQFDHAYCMNLWGLCSSTTSSRIKRLLKSGQVRQLKWCLWEKVK